MLETPCIPPYQAKAGDNGLGADDQQERPEARASGILRDYTPNTCDEQVKI